MALWIGLYPKPFFQILEQPVNQLVQTIHDKSNANAPVNAQVTPVPALPAPAVVGPRPVAPKVVRPKASGTTSAGPKASN
jgi:hypothetical protein